MAELSSSSTPDVVRAWINDAPDWIKVVSVDAARITESSNELDDGERAAIAYASDVRADLLLIDDAAGRAEARRRQLRVTGTLGVLRAAAELGVVDVPDVIRRLRATSFYTDD